MSKGLIVAIVLWLFTLIRSAVLWNEWKGTRQLPMQWNFSGNVTWFAPRALALGFIPVVGLLVISSMLISDHRNGSDHTYRQLAVGFGILAVHLIYTHFAKRYI